MSAHNQIEVAAEKMRKLTQRDIVKELGNANEAKTRLIIIDEVLSILGWPKEEYEPEQPTKIESYTDYRLTIEGQSRLIVEAKRIGLLSPLPKAIQKSQYQNSFLYRNYGPEMKSLLDQCLSYCTQCGVPYALATTGEIWIILHGFKLGADWGDLKSFVFHSLEDILQKFGIFYGLVSREAIKNNSLEEKLGGTVIIKPHVAMKPGELINQIPNIEQTPNQQIIRAFFHHFMSDITHPNQAEMLEQCYVDNHELNEFSRDLQQILQHDASMEEAEVPVVHEDIDQSTLERELEIQTDLINPKTILLVGNVGAGKSTFVHRFIRHNPRSDRYICTVVDLINEVAKNITGDYGEEQRLADLVLFNLAREFQDKLDPYAPEVVRGCFDNKIGRFKKQRQVLFKLDPDKYALEEEKYIFELSENKYEHLVGYINFARKKRYKIWIAFDNVDRGSDSYQQFIYSFAHRLGVDARCVTLITLRQDTFLEARDAGFLDVRSTDIVFQLHAPEFRQIISRRRKYVEKVIKNGTLPKLFRQNAQLIRLLSWHINRLLLNDNEFVRLFITVFSLNNIRYGLAMLGEYYMSPHSTFHEFYHNHENESDFDQSLNLYYETEQDRFIQALMLGSSWSYQGKQSDIFNIFSVEPYEKVSHFLMLRILAYLMLKINSSSRYSIKYEKILLEFISLGYHEHHINNALVKLLYSGLVISPNLPAIPIVETKIEIPDPLPKETKIALSARGYYYLQHLVSNTYFQTRVGEDTVWYNEELARKYASCLKDTNEAQKSGTDDSLQATHAREIFIDYLRWSLLDETETGNIRRTSNRWAQYVNNFIEQKVFGKSVSVSIEANEDDNLTSDKINEMLDAFYSSYKEKEEFEFKKERKNKAPLEQLFLFEENSIDYEQAMQEAIASLGPMPKGLRIRRSSYIVQVLWALEIAFRVGLGAIQAKEIANLIRSYGQEFITVRGVASFIQGQSKNDGEYKHLWREEPDGYYTINNFGQNMLFSQLNLQTEAEELSSDGDS